MQAQIVLSQNDLTRSGFLTTRSLKLISSKLLKQGISVFPGDHGYCVGAYAHADSVRSIISNIAGTSQDRIPIAFTSYSSAKEFVVVNRQLDAIFEAFTPGPLIVYATSSDIAQKNTFHLNREIGIKISGSPVERDIAASSPHYLLASANLVSGDGRHVRDFKEACDLVDSRTDGPGRMVGWTAVEARGFETGAATSIVFNQGSIEILEAGSLPADELERASKHAPLSDYDDWG